MWGHYLLTLYRSLTRHRLYAALNVFGLAVGIAVFLVLWLDVRFETSFERWIPNASQIYTLRTSWVGPGGGLPPVNSSMGAILDELHGDYPQLVGVRTWGASGSVRQGARITPEGFTQVDPSFFQVFDLPLIAGDKATLLRRPDEVVLTQAKAKLYFGAANPIGRPLTLFFRGEAHDYRVAGVLKDLPPNTELQLDFLVPLKIPSLAEDPYWRHWGSQQLSTYLRFLTPEQAKALDDDFDRFSDRHAGSDLGPGPAHTTIRIRTLLLTAAHLLNPKDAAVVAGLSTVGLLTLLLAGVNYVNLATARAGLRAREVAVRKVMGATRSLLMVQFMSEALATALLAALIGLTMCEIALPLVNAAGGLSLKIDYFGSDGLLLAVLLVVAVVGFGAGLYPALVLSRFHAAAVLASARTPGGGRAGGRVREVLVVIQFAIAIAFTIGTGVIVNQTGYLRRADLGFRREGLIVIQSINDSALTADQRANILAAWRAVPGVVHATLGDIAPGVDDNTNSGNTKLPGTPGEGRSFNYVWGGEDFLQTYGARLIAGRFPDRSHGGDFPPKPPEGAKVKPLPGNVVLNMSAVRALGFHSAQEAAGKTIGEGAGLNTFVPHTIIGVVEDIRFRSPRDPVPPTIYRFSLVNIEESAAGVRFSGADPQAVMARLATAWRRIAPTSPFRAKTIDDSLQHYYRPDDQHGRLFTIGAVLAVGIGCIGLYGLASFNTARRVKEIGIRKTLGASTGDVLKLLVGQFLRPVLLANLIAWPLAYLAMQNWLSGFDQRIGLSPLYFLAATALTLAIALATVAGQAFAVARAEPAKALRHE